MDFHCHLLQKISKKNKIIPGTLAILPCSTSMGPNLTIFVPFNLAKLLFAALTLSPCTLELANYLFCSLSLFSQSIQLQIPKSTISGTNCLPRIFLQLLTFSDDDDNPIVHYSYIITAHSLHILPTITFAPLL